MEERFNVTSNVSNITKRYQTVKTAPRRGGRQARNPTISYWTRRGMSESKSREEVGGPGRKFLGDTSGCKGPPFAPIIGRR